MGLRNLIPQAWRSRRNSDTSTIPTYSPELRNGPLHLDTNSRQCSFPSSSSGPASLRGSPERYLRDSLLDRVQEETDDEPVEPADDEAGDNDDLDWELEQIGMYRGSYTRLIYLFGIVPLSSLLLLLFIAVLPPLIWPLPESTHFPSIPNFPFPYPEVLTSIALWSLSHTIHVPLYTFFAFLAPANTHAATVLATTVHVICTNVFRLSACALLQMRHEMDYLLPTWRDPAFERIIWLAVGWSAAEVAVSVCQGYEMIGLYKDVVVPEGREGEVLAAVEDGTASPLNGSGFLLEDQNTMMDGGPKPTITALVDQDLDHLLAFKAREEVEEVYGMPAIKIPVFISTMQRINSIFLSLGFNLLLSAAYFSSPLSFPDNSNAPRSNLPIAVAFPLLTLLHLSLSVLHTPLVLPRIGLHTASYIGLIVSLGSVFGGLAVWDALS